MYQRRMSYLSGAAAAMFALHILEQRLFGFSEALATVRDWYGVYASWFTTADGALIAGLAAGGLLALLFLFLLFLGGKWQAIPAIFFGLLLLTEIHHFLGAVRAERYYPGAVTGLILTGLGIAIVKESVRYLFARDRHAETTA